mmetsp:Transcript_49260/g.56744  ORF Transcript_49260/g.56744 Transcript_49260/m.56744 type:complete len:102 (-) Transcript_49260:24-329(-)
MRCVPVLSLVSELMAEYPEANIFEPFAEAAIKRAKVLLEKPNFDVKAVSHVYMATAMRYKMSKETEKARVLANEFLALLHSDNPDHSEFIAPTKKFLNELE